MSSNEQPEGTDSRVEDGFGHIDPDRGRSAHAGDDSEGAPPAEDDPDSPGATIDDAEPAEPNEPG